MIGYDSNGVSGSHMIEQAKVKEDGFSDRNSNFEIDHDQDDDDLEDMI